MYQDKIEHLKTFHLQIIHYVLTSSHYLSQNLLKTLPIQNIKIPKAQAYNLVVIQIYICMQS